MQPGGLEATAADPHRHVHCHAVLPGSSTLLYFCEKQGEQEPPVSQQDQYDVEPQA